MIISKTPFRISLMGGGTDLRAFYRHGHGAVVATSIDKFVYLAIHRFFDRKIVLKYSQTETVEQLTSPCLSITCLTLAIPSAPYS